MERSLEVQRETERSTTARVQFDASPDEAATSPVSQRIKEKSDEFRPLPSVGIAEMLHEASGRILQRQALRRAVDKTLTSEKSARKLYE